jgi:hypothetical protein
MSESRPEAALEGLIHDINSKCFSLKGAVSLLAKASPEEGGRLLTMMKQAAQDLVLSITEMEKTPWR